MASNEDGSLGENLVPKINETHQVISLNSDTCARCNESCTKCVCITMKNVMNGDGIVRSKFIVNKHACLISTPVHFSFINCPYISVVGEIRTPSPPLNDPKDILKPVHLIPQYEALPNSNFKANDGSAHRNQKFANSQSENCKDVSDTIVPHQLTQYSNTNGNSDNVAFNNESNVKCNFLNSEESTKEPPSALYTDSDKFTSSALQDTKLSHLSGIKNFNNNVHADEPNIQLKTEIFDDCLNERDYNVHAELNCGNNLKRKNFDESDDAKEHSKKIRSDDSDDFVQIETAQTSRPSSKMGLVENIDYKLLAGKKDLDLLTAIEMQTNVNLAKMEFHMSSGSDFSNSDKESPRKAQRTRSLEFSATELHNWSSDHNHIKRPRSADCAPCDIQFDLKSYTKLTKSEVPIETNHKESKPRNRKDEKSDHRKSSSGRSYSEKRKHRNVAIQARSDDHNRHDLKIMHPRPSLLLSGNFTYPPNDVRRVTEILTFCYFCFLR